MNEAPDHPIIVKMERDGYIEVPEPLYDVYDKEIVEGETYFENQYGEAIAECNLLRYLAEEKILEEKNSLKAATFNERVKKHLTVLV